MRPVACSDRRDDFGRVGVRIEGDEEDPEGEQRQDDRHQNDPGDDVPRPHAAKDSGCIPVTHCSSKPK